VEIGCTCRNKRGNLSLLKSETIEARAVLFDLFDTLLLIEADKNVGRICLKSVYQFLSANGINVSFKDFKRAYCEARTRLYEGTGRELEEPHYRVRISETLKRLGYEYDPSDPVVSGAAEAYCEEFIRHIHPDEDAYHVLRRLRENGYKIGVVSNFAIPECARKLISLHGLKDFLDVIVISAEINRRKPSPEIFKFALESLGVNGVNAIFIGDTPDIDVRGARYAGMKAILIERKSMDANAGDKPDFTIKRLRELLDLLKIK